MKRILILLITVLLLAACGNKVHENISEDMAKDTEQVLGIFDKVLNEDRDLTDREQSVFDDYVLLYGAKQKAPVTIVELTEEENRLFILTRKMIEMYERSSVLSSDKDSYRSQIKIIQSVIKTGKI